MPEPSLTADPAPPVRTVLRETEDLDAVAPRTVVAGRILVARKTSAGEWMVTGAVGAIPPWRMLLSEPEWWVIGATPVLDHEGT